MKKGKENRWRLKKRMYMRSIFYRMLWPHVNLKNYLQLQKRENYQEGMYWFKRAKNITRCTLWLVVRPIQWRIWVEEWRLQVLVRETRNKERFAAGEAGVCVGELGNLDNLWAIDKRGSEPLVSSLPTLSKESPSSKDSKTLSTAPSNNAPAVQKEESQISGTHATNNAILRYIGAKDLILYEWDYADLANLMKQSADLRSSVTRAMTAAVVGKVIDLCIKSRCR